MLTNERKARIQERLKNTIPIETPEVWYHEDVPMLLRAIDIAKKTCPNGGNDGYITPRPCQCEVDGLITERDMWKSKAESLERVKAYWDSYYGQGLEVANWHMNGTTELFDNFWESAEAEMNNYSNETEGDVS